MAFLTFLLLAHPGVIYLTHQRAKPRLLGVSVSLSSVMIPSPRAKGMFSRLHKELGAQCGALLISSSNLLAPKHYKLLKGLDLLEPEHALFSGSCLRNLGAICCLCLEMNLATNLLDFFSQCTKYFKLFIHICGMFSSSWGSGNFHSC